MTAKDFVVKWNNTFVYDKWYRMKYNIPFNSEHHRQQSQIDIYFEYLEEVLYKESLDKRESLNKDKEELKKGNWIKEKATDKVMLDVFENLDISQLNSNSQFEIKE